MCRISSKQCFDPFDPLAHSYHIQFREPISCKEKVVSVIKLLPLRKQEKRHPKLEGSKLRLSVTS